MRYTALVPARSGSKRLPNKNIKLLGSKPLFVWTLEACVRTEAISEVILSTDSLEYWEIAQKYVPSEKLKLDLRHAEEAGDKVKIFDYVKESHQKIFGNRGGAFILCLPTVPLRRKSHITEAIDLFEAKKMPVFSATNYGFPVAFAFEIEPNDDWKPAFEDSPMFTGNTRSQGQKEMYHPNGAIYVRELSDLHKPGLASFYEMATPYVMDRSDSVDIDAEIDFRVAEALLNQE